MTDAETLTIAGCDPTIAAILAADIDFGWSDATAYVGPSFADFQGRAIENQINDQQGDASALEQLGIMPELAKAIAGAINARKARP